MIAVRSLTSTLALALLVGCAQIPPEAIKLNEEVSQKITISKVNSLRLIDAWERSRHALIEEEWGYIYSEATRLYNAKPQQVREDLEGHASKPENIGELAALIMEGAKTRISAMAQEMRQVVENNAQEIVAANDSITRLLASANAVGQTRAYILDRLKGVLPFEIPNVTKVIHDEVISKQ